MDICEVLHKIQQDLKAPKNQTNTFGQYKYRSCEDILEAVKKVIAKGYYIILSDEIVSVGGKNYIKAMATLCGEGSILAVGYAREAESQKGMNDSQLTGSTSSYARKYALNGLFAIDDTKDSDATNQHGEEKGFEPKPNTRATKTGDAKIDKDKLAWLRKKLKEKDLDDNWLVEVLNTEYPDKKIEKIDALLDINGEIALKIITDYSEPEDIPQ